MSSHAQQEAPPIAGAEEKEEVCKRNEEIPSSSAAAEAPVDELRCLSGEKPFFDIILSKSHVTHPFTMNLPLRAVNKLPSGDARLVVTHRDRKWDIRYIRSGKVRRFWCPDWKKFVEDNDLKKDDACIFEVMESSPTAVELKVLFLRDTKRVPPQLRAETEPRGRTAETAVELD